MADILLIHPGGAHGIYGKLGDELTALEQPLWPRLIAGYLLDRGHTVQIIDMEAKPQLSPKLVASLIKSIQPRLIAIVAQGHQPSASTQSMPAARDVAQAIKAAGVKAPIVLLGNHASALPERTLREEPVDFVVDGEGPVTLDRLLKSIQHSDDNPIYQYIPGLVWRDGNLIYRNPPAPLLDLDRDLHGRAWQLLPPLNSYRAHNWQTLGESSRTPYAAIYTSLGCPYTCLSGDTSVNTIYGNIPIKELCYKYGDVGVPIYTRKEGKVIVAQAIRIRKYGQSRLIRAHFDDDSYIDCTPDHNFMQFNWSRKRGSRNIKEYPIEAQALKGGVRVRALKVSYREDGRVYLSCEKKNKKQSRSRMIMEFIVKRPLLSSEVVHHKDHNKSNDDPSNLELHTSDKSHFAEHPEIAERMRKINFTNNPMKRQKYKWWIPFDGGSSYRGINPKDYRDTMGFRYKNGKTHSEVKRDNLTNHRVISIELLDGLHDVYCLEVPETGWFYANDVLVKNCSFCMINIFQHTNRYRMRSPEAVVAEIGMLYRYHGVRTFKIVDELFCLNRNHVRAICQQLVDRQFEEPINIWAYARTDTVDFEDLPLMRAAGIRWLALGIESGTSDMRISVDKRLKGDTDSNADIFRTVRAIQNAGINVIGNYIFGLPEDNLTSMSRTLELAQSLNTEWANFYTAQAYPGSKLYDEAIAKGWALPETWAGYSQHNRHCRPLDTRYVSAAEVLRFRDEAFSTYFSAPIYRSMIEQKFGSQAVAQVDKMLEYKLQRDLLGGE